MKMFRIKTTHLVKMVMLLALMLATNGVWAQTYDSPSTPTSETYKFKGKVAERVYAPDMPYSMKTHHQTKIAVNRNESVILFSTNGKGLSKAGKFSNGDDIKKYQNFVIRTSDLNGGIMHYRLNFRYNTNKTRHLDIYRHLADKKDGLAVIALKTDALFQSDDEIDGIYQVDVQVLDFDNRRLNIESCYFITAMPDLDYTDIDGAEIGNAYLHPSYLIPSNGVNIYPSKEADGVDPATIKDYYEDYIVEIETTTNYTNADGTIKWTPENSSDSLCTTNPTLVWSLPYDPRQNMSDVTYTTIDRWGGNAIWRWIFVDRTLNAMPSSENIISTNLNASYFKKWKSIDANSEEVVIDCDYNLNTYSTSVYGKKDAAQRGVGLHTSPYSDYKYLVVKRNVFTYSPKFQFLGDQSGSWAHFTVDGTGYGDDFVYVDLETLRSKNSALWLTSIFGDPNAANVTHVYLAKELSTGWATINLHKSMYNIQNNYNGTWDNSSGDNGTIYGCSSVWESSYVDLSNYDNLDIHVSNGVWPRLIFNRVGNDGNDYLEISEATKNNDGIKQYISDWGNTKRINLNKIKENYSNAAKLNVIKNPNGANVVSMELIKYGNLSGINYVTLSGDNVKHLDKSDYHAWNNLEDLGGIPAFADKTTSTESKEVMYGADDTYMYAKLDNYDYMEVRVTEGQPLLVFNKDGNNAIICYPNMNGAAYYKVIDGVYTINLKQMKEDKGYVHLNGILNWASGESTTTTFNGAVKLQKLDGDLASNYTLTDKDVIHYYNSVYNGDFTNTPYGCHNGNHGTRDRVNYSYYQVRGNEYNYVYDTQNIPDNRKLIKDGDTVIGYYANVTADNKLVDESEIVPVTMHMHDICITKNRVKVRQNHADVAKLFKNHSWGGEFTLDSSASNTEGSQANTYLGCTWNMSSVNADLTGYSSLRLKGSPKSEYELNFNGGMTNSLSLKMRLDANGYGEINLSELKGIAADVQVDYRGNSEEKVVAGQAGHLYLSSIKKTDKNVGSLEYVRAVKDKDDNANGVHVLTKEDFHTWNGLINATVTRKIANGKGVCDQIGQSLGAGGVWLGINGTRGKEFQSYAELTGYKYMKFTGSANAKVRVIANVWDDGSQYQAAKIDKTITLDGEGVGYLDISNNQYFHLNVICNPNDGSSAQLDQVLLLPDPRVDYVLEGNGTLSLEAAQALMDPTACVIDVRPRVNNKRVIDIYSEEVYRGGKGQDVYDIAKNQFYIDDMDGNTSGHNYETYNVNKRYVRMGNPNCLVIMRADYTSKDKEHIFYKDFFETAQYWHGIRLMHHANNLTLPNDYGEEGSKVMTAGLFLVDGFPYRIPFDIHIVSGNTACYARYINQQEKPLVNTICLPFPVTLCSNSGDNNKATANAATSRTALNDAATLTNWYKITDLVHNVYKQPIKTAGLLQQDDLRQDEYVFLYEKVNTLDAYTPYVFVNGQNEETHDTSSRDNMKKREGGRIEVYSSWPDSQGKQPMLKIKGTVDATGAICQNMDNSAHKTDINGDRNNDPIIDDYYLYGTNAPVHEHDNCWYFNANGYLVKADYMTNNGFRAILKSKTRNFNAGFETLEEKQSSVKVVDFDTWMNAEDETAIEAVTDAETTVAVYNVNGILLRPAVKLGEALEGLPRGIYIVDGQKTIKK